MNSWPRADVRLIQRAREPTSAGAIARAVDNPADEDTDGAVVSVVMPSAFLQAKRPDRLDVLGAGCRS
jgi:hypothetical protein